MGLQTITIDTAEGFDTAKIKTMPKEDFTRFIDPEIHAFEEAFMGLGQSALIGVETTLLRTYLAWKLRGI